MNVQFGALIEGQEQGARQTVEAIFRKLKYCDITINGLTEEWVAHIAATNGECECDLSYDYDGQYDVTYCPWYKNEKNRRAWYLSWQGMTEEELLAKERRAAKQEFERKQLAAAQEKERRRLQLLELAEEFGVDPKLLP